MSIGWMLPEAPETAKPLSRGPQAARDNSLKVRSDVQLLREYAATGASAPFAELVARHCDLVWSVARRQVRDPHLAEDVAQAVFILLARKAKLLDDHVVMSAWLVRTARFASRDALKMQARRKKHESKASEMLPVMSQIDDPLEREEKLTQLDDALSRLSDTDRAAVLLRYYEHHTHAQIGAILNIDEEAARKRVARATERLRTILRSAGAAMTLVVLSNLMGAHLAQAAPVGLAGNIVNSAMAAGSGAASVGAGHGFSHHLASNLDVSPLVTRASFLACCTLAFGIIFSVGGVALHRHLSTPPQHVVVPEPHNDHH
jgi:RNA polymerase sigma factor (sigma-70 family)